LNVHVELQNDAIFCLPAYWFENNVFKDIGSSD
jgi:hypothetical protein